MLWAYAQHRYGFMSPSGDGDVFAFASCVFTPILSVTLGLAIIWCIMKQIREFMWEKLSDPVH